MSLFEFNIEVKELPDLDSMVATVEDAAHSLNLSAFEDFAQSGLSIDAGDTIFFLSDKRWSLHQLIAYYIKQMVWADVWITTYGINEHSMRQVANMKSSGSIRKLYFLFSDHVKKIKPKEIQIAETIATAHCMYPSHAKIVVLKNSTHQVLIVSSMNLNRNNKLEAGSITTNPSAVSSFITFLNTKLCIPLNS